MKHYSIHAFTALIMAFFALPTYAQEPIQWNLKQCIDYAIENNLSLKKADNQIQQDKLNKQTKQWSRLPSVDANASQGWNWGRSPSPIDNRYSNVRSANTNFGLSTNLPLFTGLELPNQYALSKIQLKASLADLAKAKEDLSIQVTNSYIQVLFNQEICEVARHQVELSQEQLDMGRAKYELGKLSYAELTELESRLKQDEMQYVETRNNYQLALLDLSQLLELPTPDNFRILPLDEHVYQQKLSPPDQIYVQALQDKPVILAAQLRSEGAKKNIRLAQSGFMPKLSFNASISSGYYSVQGRDAEGFRHQLSNNLSKYVGFSLSIPIFNRMNTINQVRSAKIDFNNQRIQLEEQKKGLYKEIQQAWYSATAAQTKFDASSVALDANRQSFELIKEKYELGKANNLEFNEAKLSLMKAESDLIQAKYNYLLRTKILNFYKGEPIE